MIWKAIALLALGVSVLGHNHHRHYAYSEQKVELHNVQRGHHGELGHIGHYPEHHHEYANAYPSYEFSYKVSDPHTHDFKGQHESRDGDVVKGEYWLVQPDGVKRTVKYHSDKHSGFKAQVHYDGPHKHIEEHHPRHIEHHEKVEHHHDGEKEKESRENEKREREIIKYMMNRERENRERENKYRESEDAHHMKEHHKHQILKHKPVVSHVVSIYKERESEREGENRGHMGKIPLFDFERIEPKVEHKEHHMHKEYKEHKEHKEEHKKYSGYHHEIHHPYSVHKEKQNEFAHKEERAEPEKRMEEENFEGHGGHYNKHNEPYYGHKRHYYQH